MITLRVIISLIFLFISISDSSKLNDIVYENSLSGANREDWWYEQPVSLESIERSKSIQGYTVRFSYIVNEVVEFKVSCYDTIKGIYYLDIFRLGYYGGSGARLIDTVTVSDESSQFYQPHCVYENEYRLVDCSNWRISASWLIPFNVTTGVYIALPRDKHGNKGSYIPFVIRRNLLVIDTKSNQKRYDLLFKTSDLTWVK